VVSLAAKAEIESDAKIAVSPLMNFSGAAISGLA
jgi:hypothetical protein